MARKVVLTTLLNDVCETNRASQNISPRARSLMDNRFR